MIEQRQSRGRKLAIDALEDRAVPSTTAAAVTSGNGGNQALVTELNQFGGQAASAYAAFAASVRQAELTLLSLPVMRDVSTPPTPGNATTVLSTITQQLGVLSQTLSAAAYTASSNTSSSSGTLVQLSPIAGLLQSQLTGPAAGSVASQMDSLFATASAGSTNASVPQGSLPLLFAAVDGVIAASYNSTALNGYYFATGQLNTSSSGSTASTGSSTAFDLTSVGTQENTAYGSFATSVRQAEATLVGSTDVGGKPVAAPGTPATVAATIGQQIDTLTGAISSAFSPTAASAGSAALTGSYMGLATQMASLLGAASAGSTDGSVPQGSLPLLFAAVDGAIAASYDSTAVNTYLLATNQNYIEANNSSSSSGGSSNGGTTVTTGGGVTTGPGPSPGTTTTGTGTGGTGTIGTGTTTTTTGGSGTGSTTTGNTGTGTTTTGNTGTGTTTTGNTGTGTTTTGNTGTGTTGTGTTATTGTTGTGTTATTGTTGTTGTATSPTGGTTVSTGENGGTSNTSSGTSSSSSGDNTGTGVVTVA